MVIARQRGSARRTTDGTWSLNELDDGSRDQIPAIQGQLLRQSERREVAIYLRDGKLWIADFMDGVGEIVEPAAWFRFNCGTPWARRAHRRMLFESATPLSAELAARIECLHHRESDVGEDGERPP
jgi:hypothetical protein